MKSTIQYECKTNFFSRSDLLFLTSVKLGNILLPLRGWVCATGCKGVTSE